MWGAGLQSERERRAYAVIALAAVVLVAATVVYLKPHLPSLPGASAPVSERVCDASFADARHGAVVLCSAAGATHEAVSVTSDGGRSWHRAAVDELTEAHVGW